MWNLKKSQVLPKPGASFPESRLFAIGCTITMYQWRKTQWLCSWWLGVKDYEVDKEEIRALALFVNSLNTVPNVRSPVTRHTSTLEIPSTTASQVTGGGLISFLLFITEGVRYSHFLFGYIHYKFYKIRKYILQWKS